MNIEDKFEQYKVEHNSDIKDHLQYLYETAKKYNIICEFGTRTGRSTFSFLKAVKENKDAKLTCYDIRYHQDMNEIVELVKNEKLESQFELKIRDVLSIDPIQCDLLFIDTLHTYDQLKEELKIHVSNNPNPPKSIIFHDTETFALVDEFSGSKGGLLAAILEFLVGNKSWKINYYNRENNGLIEIYRDE